MTIRFPWCRASTRRIEAEAQLHDLRRLIRQYSRTEANTFPRGNYFKGGTYGTDVNFPVPDLELPNPQFKGCIDRNA